MEHTPVLMRETVEGLNLFSGALAVDATVGLGGHAKRILEATAPGGHVYAFDRDSENLAKARKNLAANGKRVTFIHDSFANLGGRGVPPVDAVLFDLGFSSVHVDDASRGFSFQNDGPLDMRYDTRQELTAEIIVNSSGKEELAAIFRKLGEEPMANQIADAITKTRKKDRIVSTTQLADLIASVSPRRGKIHPATKVFQALRMAVNDELGQIEKGLHGAIDLLKPGGRLCAISFHSIEDRVVKHLIKGSDQLRAINKRVIKPTLEEQKENPRSRSAKLRIAEKI